MLGGARRSLFQLLLLYVVLLVCANPCVAGLNSSSTGADIKCIEEERHALLMIKKDLVDEFDHLFSWGEKEGQKDCCNWRGIRCNDHTGHVTVLDLGVQNYFVPLGGKISLSLLELQHLTYLDLSYNDFGRSQIPSFIGSLTKLTYLDLSNAHFVGTIPYQLGNLTSLRSLGLNNNDGLSSDNTEWLSYLSSLRYLDMSQVNLEKAINWFQSINMLPSIVHLRLQSCSLSSIIPPHLPSFNSSISLVVLDLRYNDLTSKIYPWLFKFCGSSLVKLDLWVNLLEGPLPDAFENMTSLAHLYLFANQIDGGIPKSLGNLLHLQTLDISFNKLSENLPEIVRNLSGHAMNTLEILDLSGNKINGYVPDITIFSSLKELRLSYNNLNGALPSKFGHTSKLEFLDMGGNQLTGPFPDFSSFPSLRELYLSNNKINGSLPKTIAHLSKLEDLYVSSNQLQGTISEAHFSNLTKLKYLDLSSNDLSLNISSNWLPPFQLERLGLGSCKLGPDFPFWLRTQKNVSYLDISNAEISDVIPAWFWDQGHISSFLNLSLNHIEGILPDLSLTFFTDFPTIDLSSNHLEGPLPSFPSNTTSLDLSNNALTGPISVLCEVIGRKLSYLDLSNNLLSGQLPDCWWQWDGLYVLNLDNNYFDGKIPSSMGSLLSIHSLHLRNNSLIGELPSSLRNCTGLYTIDVGENKLSGNVPAWIGENLSDLIILRLRSNAFNGSIPVQLCHLKSVQVFDMSLNKITGTIPGCLKNLSAIAQKEGSPITISVGYNNPYIAKALISWKGRIFEYGSTLGLVKSIDLSSNKLIGKIPLGITNLSGLLSLNLSRNNLAGPIPLDIGRLRMLESLDLSRNRLFGKIPMSLSDLNGLSSLDLSHNNLSGKIPSSTQLQSLEASAFTENPSLCGPPLTQKCPGDYTNQVTPTTSGAGEDAEVDEFVLDRWFYASLALGFIVGFWGVCGTLVLKQSWRHAYFRFFDNSKDWLHVKIVVHTARFKRKLRAGLDRFF